MSVILNKEYNVVVNSVEVIDTTEHLMIQTRCQLNWCHYDWVQL